MKTWIKIILCLCLIFSIYYIFFHKSLCYIPPERWIIDGENNKITITVSRSYSYTKWKHFYEKTGNDLYIKVYTLSYLNPFIHKSGINYTFEIPESLQNIKNIYSYDNNSEPIIIYENNADIQKSQNDSNTVPDIEQRTILEDNQVMLKNESDKFENELKSSGILFTRNDEIEYHLSEEDALEVIADFIESNKDNIKYIKVEQLLYTNDGDKNLEKEIPVSVITLYGGKLKSPSGTPFGRQSQSLEYDDSNFISKIIIDDATKEIINMFQIYSTPLKVSILTNLSIIL